MSDGKLEVVFVCRANAAGSQRIQAMSPRLRGVWMWTMTMLTSTRRDELRGCLCVGIMPMTFEEWRRSNGLRVAEAETAWNELFRVGSFEFKTIHRKRYVHVYGFEANQDRLYKRKGEPVGIKTRTTMHSPSNWVDNSDGSVLRESDNSRLGCSAKSVRTNVETVGVTTVGPIGPVDKSGKTVDNSGKSVDNSGDGGTGLRGTDDSCAGFDASCVRPIVDTAGVTTPESANCPIINNVPLKILTKVTVRGAAAGPSPPSLPGAGTNGTGKPNNATPRLRGQRRAQNEAMSVPENADRPEEPPVDATGPPVPTQRQENGTERSTERAVDDRRGGEGPAAAPRTGEGCRPEAVGCRPEERGEGAGAVSATAVNKLIEELVRGLHDEHSRAFWTRVVREFGRRQDGFVQLVAEWEGMKGRIVEGTGPRNPRSTMNKWSLDRLCELGNVWALGRGVGREGKC